MSIKTESTTHENPPIAESVSKEINYKYGMFHNKMSHYTKNMKLPHSKKKIVSDSSCLTDASAKVVLSERNVEIKDLESKVKFLKSKIKELENENKMLQNVQFRQERELKKFEEGITDIPALLKSHKEEMKVCESTISSIRKELKDCQKDLKLRSENLLRKENQIDKINVNLKQNEKLVHEYLSEIKVLIAEKKVLEEENKEITVLNENLKNKNDDLCKQVKDLDMKMQNLEENLNKESDTNKNLKNELNELKEKYERELRQVPNDENTQERDCEDQIQSKTADNFPSVALSGISSVNNQESEIENVQNSTAAVLNEENLCSFKAVDRTKDVLIHTFKNTHHFCNLRINNSGAGLFETGVSNIKLLPPLKTPSKESFTSLASAFGNRECILSSFDLNSNDRVKYSQNDVLTKEQLRKSADNYEIGKSKNTANLSCDFKTKGTSNFFHFSSNDVNNERQNCKNMKDIHGIKRNDVNEMKSLNSSCILKDTRDTKKCGSCLSKSLKFQDYLLCENVKQNTQIPIENNVHGKILEEENHSFFPESPKYVNESLLYCVNENDFECESDADKYKGGNHKHSKTFLKQTKNTKPIVSSHFDELSEQKNPENHHELSWWDKW